MGELLDFREYLPCFFLNFFRSAFDSFSRLACFFLLTPALLLVGLFVEENLNFCAGYFRFGLLKVTFPRGFLEEMMREWKEISGAVIQEVKVNS